MSSTTPAGAACSNGRTSGPRAAPASGGGTSGRSALTNRGRARARGRLGASARRGTAGAGRGGRRTGLSARPGDDASPRATPSPCLCPALQASREDSLGDNAPLVPRHLILAICLVFCPHPHPQRRRAQVRAQHQRGAVGQPGIARAHVHVRNEGRRARSEGECTARARSCALRAEGAPGVLCRWEKPMTWKEVLDASQQLLAIETPPRDEGHSAN